MHDEIHPTPLGLLRCLQVLTEEAACLGLTQTSAALHQAIEACRAESDRRPAQPAPRTDRALLN